jgi:hypothetical protein
MPTPYYDALDGYPAYLLVNDGQGQFRDQTEAAGLGAKRTRRTYSASLVDLDDDGDLDLLVVNDFAGVDTYRNDGRGRFQTTTDWIADPRGFGMAHALGDFDRDGQTDLFITGMHCPTAVRLDHLGLRRPGFETMDAQRGLMTRGNRIFLRRENRFETTPLGDFAARSGWSWSCAVADVNNDGFPDIFIANGHETRQSVRDYDAEFWRHDIYVGSSKDDLLLNVYFGSKFLRTRGRGWSYGGYEANRLFLNQEARRFDEVAFLAGVAIPEDSRNAVADDLDGDGREDLIATTFESWPEVRQTLRVYQNQLRETGNWIGFRLRAGRPGRSTIGSRIVLEGDDRKAADVLVTGDSHRVQRAGTAHFGLGRAGAVRRVTVRWPDGTFQVLDRPGINRYHDIQRP